MFKQHENNGGMKHLQIPKFYLLPLGLGSYDDDNIK